MKTGAENYSKVVILSLGDIGVIYNTNKPKYTNNIKRIIDYGKTMKKSRNINKNKRRKII